MSRIIKLIIEGGVVLIIWGGFLTHYIINYISINQKKEDYVETTATVVDYSYNYEEFSANIVEYEVDGKTYNKTSDSYSYIQTPLGTGIKIYYNPDDPNDAIWATEGGNIIVIIVNGIFLIAVLSVLIRTINKAYKMKKEERDNLIKQSMQNNQYTQNNQNVQTNPNNQQIEEINLSDINK